jgi:hypothetical protein
MNSTQLYRHWDENNILLYVGISYSSTTRLRQHEKSARWFKLVRSVTIEQFATRKEAELAELHAIRTENPIYNIVGVLDSSPKVTPIRKLRWKKPTYKYKGKRLLRADIILEYIKLLNYLEEGKLKYILPKELFSLEVLEELREIIGLTPEAYKIGTMSIAENLCLINSIRYDTNSIVSFYVNDRVLPIFLEARETNDTFLRQEYYLAEKNLGVHNSTRIITYPTRPVQANWYTQG